MPTYKLWKWLMSNYECSLPGSSGNEALAISDNGSRMHGYAQLDMKSLYHHITIILLL